MHKETAMAFVEAINGKDTKAILSLMAEDHVFIDAYGRREDKKAMEQGWPGYFAWFPDYKIEVDTLLEQDDTVVLLGYAGGTYQGRHRKDGRYTWRLPAAWRVVVADEKIAVWQVYADSKIPYEIIEKGEGTELDSF